MKIGKGGLFYNDILRAVLLGALLVLTLSSVYFAAFRPEEFSTVFAAEDHVVEYATAILLACAGAVLASLSRRVTGHRKLLLIVYALAFLVAAGEEISWGQRIFDIESNEFFRERNLQGETNFHNLVIGEEQLAVFWFGPVLSLVILIYLVVITLLYPLSSHLRRILDIFAVPVAETWVAPVAVLWSVLVVWIDLPRNWEAYECVFGILVCIIFLAPRNRSTFGFEDGPE